MPIPAFHFPASHAVIPRPAAGNALCRRHVSTATRASNRARISACAPAPPPGAASAALSPRGQTLLREYLSAPLYAAADDAVAEDTAAVLGGEAVGPASFTGVFASLVSAARAEILANYDGICAPGGALHPSHRADACWRDLRQFLAVAGGVAFLGGSVRRSALAVLRELYAELQVPLPAMRTGLLALASGVRAGAAPEAAAAALEEIAAGLK